MATVGTSAAKTRRSTAPSNSGTRGPGELKRAAGRGKGRQSRDCLLARSSGDRPQRQIQGRVAIGRQDPGLKHTIDEIDLPGVFGWWSSNPCHHSSPFRRTARGWQSQAPPTATGTSLPSNSGTSRSVNSSKANLTRNRIRRARHVLLSWLLARRARSWPPRGKTEKIRLFDGQTGHFRTALDPKFVPGV